MRERIENIVSVRKKDTRSLIRECAKPEPVHSMNDDGQLQCSVDTVVCAEWHPLERNQIVSCGKGHLSFWSLDNGGMLYKRMGIFESREKPRYVTCVAFNQNGDVLTGDSNGNIIVWGKGKIKKKNHIGEIRISNFFPFNSYVSSIYI